MLTPGEIQSTGAALDAMLSDVQAAEQAASDSIGIVDRTAIAIIPGYSGTASDQDAIETAQVKRNLYDVLLAKRNEIVESPDEAHEEALEIVSLANKSLGRQTAAAIRTMVASNDPLNIAASAIGATISDVTSGIKWLGLAAVAVVLVALFLRVRK